jgi:hypothetical protein
MKPKNSPSSQPTQIQLFQSRLDSQINLDHPLCHLADTIQWQRFDEAYAAFYCQDNGAPGLKKTADGRCQNTCGYAANSAAVC